MTQVAIIDRPCDLAIMAGTTEFSVGNLFHAHIVGTHPHLESEFHMANPALEANTVKPVRKYNGPDAFLLRTPVKHDVGILRSQRCIKCDARQK